MSEFKKGDRIRRGGGAVIRYTPTAGDIGEPQRHIEFEPLPETEPIQEPTPSVPEKAPANA